MPSNGKMNAGTEDKSVWILEKVGELVFTLGLEK